jgi:D-aminopeptidase
MIRESAKRAVSDIKNNKPQPFTVNVPVKVTVQYNSPKMADFASWIPAAKRLDGTRIEMIVSDMPTAYLSFQAAMLVT